jgi:hypothetical protein
MLFQQHLPTRIADELHQNDTHFGKVSPDDNLDYSASLLYCASCQIFLFCSFPYPLLI